MSAPDDLGKSPYAGSALRRDSRRPWDSTFTGAATIVWLSGGWSDARWILVPLILAASLEGLAGLLPRLHGLWLVDALGRDTRRDLRRVQRTSHVVTPLYKGSIVRIGSFGTTFVSCYVHGVVDFHRLWPCVTQSLRVRWLVLAVSLALVASGTLPTSSALATQARVVVVGSTPPPTNVSIVDKTITTTFDVTLVPRRREGTH